MIFIVVVFVGILLYAIINASTRSGGRALGRKFELLGDMKGKTLQEITKAVGDPIATSNVGNGKTLYQWAAPGYRIALLFEGDKFDDIASIYGGTAS